MRKIIVLSFVTIDGIIQAPGGPEEDNSNDFKYGGWTVPYFDEFTGKIMEEQMNKPFDLLLGRKTYEIFASYWPHHDNNWPGVNTAKKYVVSHSLKTLEWNNSFLLKNNVVEEIKRLKSEDGPSMQVHGSSELIQTLLKNDLVDELWLKIFPITLGKGKRLFIDGAIPAAFTLQEIKSSPTGVIVASYKRAGGIKTGSFA